MSDFVPCRVSLDEMAYQNELERFERGLDGDWFDEEAGMEKYYADKCIDE